MVLKDIAQKARLPSGGGLKQYLDNLAHAGIIETISHLQDFKIGKVSRYYLTDEMIACNRDSNGG